MESKKHHSNLLNRRVRNTTAFSFRDWGRDLVGRGSNGRRQEGDGSRFFVDDSNKIFQDQISQIRR